MDEIIDSKVEIKSLETKEINSESKVESIAEGEKKEEVAKTEEQKETERVEQENREKKQSRLDRRFKDLTTKVRSAESQVHSWMETLQEITGETPPTRKDYANDAEYGEAVTDYREKIRNAKNNLANAQKEYGKVEQESDKALIEAWDDKIDTAVKEMPDYEKVVKSANVPMHPSAQKAILRSKIGPNIAYHLAKNPDIAMDLYELPIEEQILEIGRLESKVQIGRKVVPIKEKSKEDPNPPPSGTIKGDKHPSKKQPGDMSLEEYSEWRKKNKG